MSRADTEDPTPVEIPMPRTPQPPASGEFELAAGSNQAGDEQAAKVARARNSIVSFGTDDGPSGGVSPAAAVTLGELFDVMKGGGGPPPSVIKKIVGSNWTKIIGLLAVAVGVVLANEARSKANAEHVEENAVQIKANTKVIVEVKGSVDDLTEALGDQLEAQKAVAAGVTKLTNEAKAKAEQADKDRIKELEEKNKAVEAQLREERRRRRRDR